MRLYYLKTVLSTVALTTLIGCGGGGGGNPPSVGDNSFTGGTTPGTTPKFKGLSSLGGTIGSDKNGTALLKLDMDGDGKFDGRLDKIVSMQIENGLFRFEGLQTLEGKILEGQLIVTIPGYVPFQRIVSFDAGQTYVVDASAAARKVALKEVVDLSKFSKSARMGMVVQFGIRKNSTKMESFSRLVSLSQLASEKSVDLNGSAVSTYQIGLDSLPDEVTLVEATMQAFDSSDAEDIKNFPGAFRGYGSAGAKSAAGGDEVALESVAFDLFEIKDQNGQPITLKESKITPSVDVSACANGKWTRYLSSAQKAIIESKGDYDDADEGWQVPIWSNKNSEKAWKFIGVANYTNSKIEMCLPESWKYLNVDFPIAISEPKKLCVNTYNQKGNPFSFVSIQGHTTGGLNAYGMTNNNGRLVLGLEDTDLTHWSFTYQSILSAWPIDINNSDIIEVNTTGCDYETNLTIVTPYTAEVKVTAKKANGDKASNSYVTLYRRPYYYQSMRTDENGTATFKVEPNKEYIVTFKAGRANVNVNGTVDLNETADSSRYADVSVQDINVAPYGNIFLGQYLINKDIMNMVSVIINGRDYNGDTLSVTSLKLDGKPITLDSATRSVSGRYYNQRGTLDIGTLELGTHTLVAQLSDGTLTTELRRTFTVTGNRKPTIEAPLVATYNGGVNNIDMLGSAIKSKAYTFAANVFDPDGNTVTTSMKLDGRMLDFVTETTLAVGEHTIEVTAKDELNATSIKEFTFMVGNQKPVITSAGVFSNPINLSLGDMKSIYARANDPDGDGIGSVEARFKDMNITLIANGGNYFYYDFNASELGVGEHNISFVAVDASATPMSSEPYPIEITIIDRNMPPTFYLPLSDKRINLGETVTYSEITIEDPENDRVSLECKVDNALQSLTASGSGMANSYQMSIANLTEGTHTVVCIATDAEGATTTDSAKILVIDPTKTVPLTIKVPMEGIIVTVHDTANFDKLQTAVTNSEGETTFNLPAGTTTTTFSLAFDPTLELTEDQVFTEMKKDVLNRAYSNCKWNNELNISQCKTADWCLLLADEDSIPTWTVDAAMLKDKNENNVTGAATDSDNNGEISKSEFYAQAVNAVNDRGEALDANGDGRLNWSEVNGDNLDINLFANVPVKSYTFNFDSKEENYNEGTSGEYEINNCNQKMSFDVNVTNAKGEVQSISVFGTGYGYANANNKNSFGAKVSNFNTDKDGKYDNMVVLRDENYKVAMIDLLLDKTAADLVDGVSYDGNSLTKPTLREVNITTGTDNGYLTVYSAYKDIPLTFVEYSRPLKKYFYDSRLTYLIAGSKSSSTNGIIRYYNHSRYYGDGRLKSSYNEADYPQLNLDVNRSTGVLKFTGTDKAKVDVTHIEVSGQKSDGQGTYDIQLIRYANQTSDFSLNDINISKAFPPKVATLLGTAMQETNSTRINVMAYEVKDETPEALLDREVSGNYIYNVPLRMFSYEERVNSNSFEEASALNQHRVGMKKIFTIKLNSKKLLR